MFKDRRDAGQRLAQRLEREQLERPVVLALPWGGILVGDAVATALDAPFEPFVARKLGQTTDEEILDRYADVLPDAPTHEETP
ncbi:hypothetical protein [Nocardioides sp. NPDC006273]|uniref:hypothetical protein n=1 Tax=Nocardioides sp. NPDC006273 TaxID=3155598 RepID=UPI0033B4F19A